MKKIGTICFLMFFSTSLSGHADFFKVTTLAPVAIPPAIATDTSNKNTYLKIKEIAKKFCKEVDGDQGSGSKTIKASPDIMKLDERCYFLKINYLCDPFGCSRNYLIDTKPSFRIYNIGTSNTNGGDGHHFLEKINENNYRFYVQHAVTGNGRYAGYPKLMILDIDLSTKKIRTLYGSYFLTPSKKTKSDIILDDITTSAKTNEDIVESWIFHWDGINWTKKKYLLQKK